jgi:hypothetical protein
MTQNIGQMNSSHFAVETFYRHHEHSQGSNETAVCLYQQPDDDNEFGYFYHQIH